MNKDKLKMWIDALRSGQYQQTQGYLAQEIDGKVQYCCLGVACEVAISDGLELGVGRDSVSISYDGEDLHLPTRVREWLGVYETPEVSGVSHGGAEISVVTANDDECWGFERIADALEAKYLKEESE